MRLLLASTLFIAFFYNISYAASNINIGYGTVTFDNAKATDEGIEGEASSLTFGYEKGRNNQAFSFGVNIYSIDDNEAFTNSTTGGIKSSSASGIGIFGDYGYKFYPSEKFILSLKAGYEAILDANRSIAYCSGCDYEKIDIDGGLYAQLGGRLYFNDYLGLNINYNKYFSPEDGLADAVYVNLIVGKSR